MKVTLKLSASEYRTFGCFLKAMLELETTQLEPLNKINLIECCENLLQKVFKNLVVSYKKKYTIVLNGFDCSVIMMGFDILTDFGQKEIPPYETACWYEVTKAIYDEVNALLRHRENVQGNLKIKQIN